MLDLFADENPNPSLRLYLELASVAGARFGGGQDTTPAAVVAHLATVAKDNEITLASLARASSVGRPLLSTLFNDPDPNPSLATIDRIVTALDAASDFDLVPAMPPGDQAHDDADDDEADDGETKDGETKDGETVDGETVDGEADDDEAENDEADDGEADDDEADDDDSEADDDGGEADDDDDSEADDDDSEADDDDDGAHGDEQAVIVGALREQNTQLQRRVVTKEAEIDHLREQGRWSTLKKLATAVGGGLVGAGIAVAVLKRRKD